GQPGYGAPPQGQPGYGAPPQGQPGYGYGAGGPPPGYAARGPSPYAAGANVAAAGMITVDDLLRTAAELFKRNVPASLATGLLFSLPALAVNLASVVYMRSFFADAMRLGQTGTNPASLLGDMTNLIGFSFAAAFVGMIFQAMARGVFAFLAIESMAGRSPSFGPALAAAFGKIHLLAIVAFLETLAVAAGLMLCILPGIFVAVMLFISTVVVMAEDANPFEALSRSVQLTEGNRLNIFLANLVVLVAWFSVACVIGIASPQADVNPLTGTFEMPSLTGQLVGVFIGHVVEIIRLVAFGFLAGVMYARIRGIRDGVDASELARVFA
ncbi:MAG: YciC family protein, partial [Myxococcota bacterium]